MSTLTKAQRTAQAEARAELLERLTPGDTVNVIQRRVSRSGMQRHLSLLIGDENITQTAAAAMGERVSWDTGYPTIKVNGCGMDMHFATVYNLARALFPNGHECTGHEYHDAARAAGVHRCPSNDHSNGTRAAGDLMHRDGGYALNHRTI